MARLPLIYNRAGVLIGMVHALMPIAVLTMVTVMRTIDANLVGAANTLGARGGQSFWRVYLPLSMPGVAAGALLVFVLSLGFFITPALLGSGREILIAQVIIEQIEQLLNWGFAGAVSVLFLCATLAVIFLYETRVRPLDAGRRPQSRSAIDAARPGAIAQLGSSGRSAVCSSCWAGSAIAQARRWTGSARFVPIAAVPRFRALCFGPWR